MSDKLHTYEFKMILFDKGDPEEIILFVGN